MKRTLFRLIILLIPLGVKSQNISAFTDYQGKLHVIEGNNDRQIYHLPVLEFKVSNEYLLYEDQNHNLKSYSKGSTGIVCANIISDLETTDYLSAYKVSDQLYVYDGSSSRLLTPNVGSFSLSDSLVIYYDTRLKQSFIYYSKQKYEVQGAPLNMFVDNIQIGANMVAYIDRNQNLVAFYRGSFSVVTELMKGTNYKIGQDILAYIHPETGAMMGYRNLESFEIDPFSPKSYEVGDDRVLFINSIGELKITKNGFTHLLDYSEPDGYIIKDSIAIYWLNERWFVVDGFKTKQLEQYIPDTVFLDDGNLCYQDNIGQIYSYKMGGEKIKVSGQGSGIISLNGNLLLYNGRGVNDTKFVSIK